MRHIKITPLLIHLAHGSKIRDADIRSATHLGATLSRHVEPSKGSEHQLVETRWAECCGKIQLYETEETGYEATAPAAYPSFSL